MVRKNVRTRGKGFQSNTELYSRARSVDAYATAEVLPNPDPILRQCNNVWTNYQEILWDAHLTAVVASRKSVTLSKDWFIEKNGAPARVVKFIETAFKIFDVRRATEEILDARFWGMQPMEPRWGKPKNFEGENKIFCIEFIGRPAWWFQFDRENKLRFRTRENIWPGEEIEPYSLINPRSLAKYDNPYGEALYSKVYWPVNFKKGGFKFWVEFAEKYGSPFAVGKPPRNAADSEFDAFYDKLVEMVKGSAVAIPHDADIEFINTSAKNSSDIYKALVTFANEEISKAILGQTLTTEAGDKGARALGQVHDNVRHDLAESDEILCEGTFNTLIRWLVDLNFGQNVVAPTFKYEHEEDIKKDLAERDKTLVDMGVKFTPKYYQEAYNLAEDDFEVGPPPAPAPAPGNPDNPEGDNAEFAELLKSKFKDQNAVDNFINLLTAEELGEQAEFVKPIIQMIKNADSFDEANEGLLKLFAKVRPEALEKNLGRALFNTTNLGIGGTED